jgi:hypothetical protein
MGKAVELLNDPTINLIVLDGLNIALRYDYLSLDTVVAALKARRSNLHVVVTGRNAKPASLKPPTLSPKWAQPSTTSRRGEGATGLSFNRPVRVDCCEMMAPYVAPSVLPDCLARATGLGRPLTPRDRQRLPRRSSCNVGDWRNPRGRLISPLWGRCPAGQRAAM